MAAEWSDIGEHINGDCVSIAEVDYGWVSVKGATGQKREAMTPTPVNIAALAAKPQYFNFHRDEESDLVVMICPLRIWARVIPPPHRGKPAD